MAACPHCGCSKCYFPLFGSDVECSNPDCKAFSPSLYPVSPTTEDASSAEDDYRGADADDTSDPSLMDEKPVYLWCNHHHDFGD